MLCLNIAVSLHAQISVGVKWCYLDLLPSNDTAEYDNQLSCISATAQVTTEECISGVSGLPIACST